jgi:hypothetical protein
MEEGTVEMLRRFLSSFFGESQKSSARPKSAAPLRVPPCHADGKPMTSDEMEIWAQMQRGLDRQWEKVARMGKEEKIGFTPGRDFRGDYLRVYGGSRIELVSPSSDWEATIEDGLVSVPRKIRDV